MTTPAATRATYPITGVPVKDEPKVGPYKKVGVRQNIDVWSNDPDNEHQVQLFVMALDRFQKIDPSTRDSYFQIAGIHGKPNVPWDEDISEEEANGKGYCTHNNVLFPPWHRAYLVLYEQRLYEIMVQDIIPNFPAQVQPIWKEAAEAWRLPFWDYGLTNKVPELVKYPTTIVPTSDGTGEERIDNPLFQFKMPNGKPMRSEKLYDFADPWSEDQSNLLPFGDAVGTSRWPDDKDVKKGSKSWKNGVVNNFKVEDIMKGGFQVADSSYGQCAEVMYRLLTIPMDYNTFSCTASLGGDTAVQNDLNLEFLHNNIHGWVGGDYGGHMAQIPVAALDPMFWLHHCNVDRLFALWQALNPTSWFDSSTVNQFALITIGLEDPETVISPQTPMRPFHKDKEGTVMVADEVRWTYDVGYTYPELQTWKEEYNPGGKFDQAAFKKDIITWVNDNYGASRKLLLEADSALGGVDKTGDGTKALDFSFSIRFLKYAFGGDPFWVRLYLTQDEGHQNPTIDLLASVYNFSQRPGNDEQVDCENCQTAQESNLKVTASITITPVLLELIKSGKNLGSLSKDEVLEFLRKRVYWRVFKAGQELPSYEVAKTELEIIGGTNDVFQSNDPSKAPVLENFQAEPTLTGGADGALDDSLKQEQTKEPPAVPKTPAANLSIGENLPFKLPLEADAVVIVESAKVDMTPMSGGSIDNTQFFFTTDGEGSDITFLLSIRREEGVIVFNNLTGGRWATETRVPLTDRFLNPNATFLVHDQGDGYEVFIDWKHVTWYKKADPTKVAKYVHYAVNEGYRPALSRQLNVRVYPAMKELFKA